MWFIGSWLAGVWLSATPQAHACGGFFCNNLDPVDQTGETVVFEVGDGVIRTHALIDYAGPADGFAWVLPAAGIPEIFLSSEKLFRLLGEVSAPQLTLTRTAEPGCRESDADTDTDADTDADTDVDFWGSGGGVVVLSEQAVGPYEAVVVDASSPDLLIEWLQANGYGVPDAFTSAVAPYLAGGMNFLALKLQKGTDAGTLPPLGVQWEGTHPSIPITLTQVAATPDLPLNVYVLGQQRAVPLSYLHVQLNPLVFDWFGTLGGWMKGVGRAADEAGGRAFATLYAGRPYMRISCDYITEGLAEQTQALSWFLSLSAHGFSGDSELLNVLRMHVPAPPTVDELSFYNEPYAYLEEWAALDVSFDSVAATADLEARIVAPCEDAARAVRENPYLTRMVSLLSPEEMTVDPIFGFNPELPEVPRKREANLHFDCYAERSILTLPGDYTLEIKGERPTEQWIADQIVYNALVIEQLSESGPGNILVDHRSEFGDTIEPFSPTDPEEPSLPPGEEKSASCGCASERVGATLPVLVALALVRASRRSRQGSPSAR